jgi:hypothetical protein
MIDILIRRPYTSYFARSIQAVNLKREGSVRLWTAVTSRAAAAAVEFNRGVL